MSLSRIEYLSLDMAGLFVHISVHGHLDVGMSGDGLKGFDISTCAC